MNGQRPFISTLCIGLAALASWQAMPFYADSAKTPGVGHNRFGSAKRRGFTPESSPPMA